MGDNQVITTLANIAVMQMNEAEKETEPQSEHIITSNGNVGSVVFKGPMENKNDEQQLLFTTSAGHLDGQDVAVYAQSSVEPNTSTSFTKKQLVDAGLSVYTSVPVLNREQQTVFTTSQSPDGDSRTVQVFVPSTSENVKVFLSGHQDLGDRQTQNIFENHQLDSSTASSIDGVLASESNTVPVTTVVEVESGSPDESSDKQGQSYACLICGDKGSGYHYSVYSCEGCKGFFKRTVQKNLAYSCKNDGDGGTCNINKFTRNNCQYCRFQKCQQMGMKREAVREDRSPGGKHRNKRKLEELSLQSDNGVTQENMAEMSELLIEKLIQAQPDLIPRYDGNIGLQSMGINELMQFGYAELKFIIDWAKRLPGFNELTMEDQMALLKSSFMELNVLRLSFRSKDFEDSIKFAEGFVVPAGVAKGMGWGKELVAATLEFSLKLKDMDIDIVEFCVLNGIVLTYPDAMGITDKMGVQALQTKMLDALWRYMSKHHPEDPRRYGKLLLRLPSLRTVSAKAAERFLSLTLDGNIQLNELVFEMIT